MNSHIKIALIVAAGLTLTGVNAQQKEQRVPVKVMIAVSPSAGQLPLAAPEQIKAPGVDTAAAAAAQQQAAKTVTPAAPVGFAVTTNDKNLREVLVRWAQTSGWVHNSEHWTIDRDLPISGVAGPDVFGSDFVGAARKLLASSEFTDRPVQPCFYSNHVVRVVPKAELCDKSK